MDQEYFLVQHPILHNIHSCLIEYQDDNWLLLSLQCVIVFNCVLFAAN